jgi:hypothetical protein
LVGELSEVRQAQLARERTTRDKRRLVAWWVYRIRGPAEPRFGNDELVRFFTNELSDKQRQQLLAMPLEQRNRELREEYRKAKSPDGKRPPRGGR